MALPDDASIKQLADQLGLTAEELDQLSPRARRLTKGDILALMGTSRADDAAKVFIVTKGNLLPKPMVTERVKDLTIADRASLGAAFGRVARDLTPQIETGKGFDTDFDRISVGDINCCCCPCTCCCAAAVAEPARII